LAAVFVSAATMTTGELALAKATASSNEDGFLFPIILLTGVLIAVILGSAARPSAAKKKGESDGGTSYSSGYDVGDSGSKSSDCKDASSADCGDSGGSSGCGGCGG
jgi:hypothetical protein